MSKELADVLAVVHWAIWYLGATKAPDTVAPRIEAVIAKLDAAAVKAVRS